jgi:uncharacterized paraquat-inducible protein A
MTANANPAYNEGSAASLGLVGCHGCAHVLSNKEKICPHCDASLHSRKDNSIQKNLGTTIDWNTALYSGQYIVNVVYPPTGQRL